MARHARIAQDPDEDVLARVRAGARGVAIGLLMQRHGSAVYRYASEALRDAALAEDVQQQVFIQAYDALPEFAGRSKVRTWLFAIARHRVLDAVKARIRLYTHVESESGGEAADTALSPGERLDEAHLRDVLADCVAELEEPSRTALVLRYALGFSYKEMSDILGERPGTLQIRVARALPVLRDAIRQRTGYDI
jgi:RNA polymerase sigma-70 factor (ECF subfamily)